MGTYNFTKPCSDFANMFIKEVYKIERGGIDAPWILNACEKLQHQALEMNRFFAEVIDRVSSVRCEIKLAEGRKQLDELHDRIRDLDKILNRSEDCDLCHEGSLLPGTRRKPHLFLVRENKVDREKTTEGFCSTIKAGRLS